MKKWAWEGGEMRGEKEGGGGGGAEKGEGAEIMLGEKD